MTALPYMDNGKLKWVESLYTRVIHNTIQPCGLMALHTRKFGFTGNYYTKCKPRAYAESYF